MEDLLENSRQSAEQKRKFKEEFAGYQKEIDEFLGKKAYGELLEYFQSDKMGIMSKIENDAAVMCIILSIYQMEMQEGVEQGIFNGIFNMESAVKRYLKIKFLIWRLEFLDESAVLLEAVDNYSISVPFFKYLIHTSSFDKVNTSFKLAMLLKEKEKLAQAFAILNYTNELGPGKRGSERVYCEMADICIRLGQLGNAAACLKNIEEPSEIFAGYQEKWGI